MNTQDYKTKKFNKMRLEMLYRPSANPGPQWSVSVVFAPAKNSDERQVLQLLNDLSPEARTELLGQMYRIHSVWYNDQQRHLQKVAG